MRRRSRAGGKSAKLQRRKTTTLKRRNTPKAKRNRAVSIAGQETVVARLTHEREEALLRESANSEILRLISKSPGDLELVFRTILEHATSICNANFGTLFRFDGKNFHPVAQFNTPAALLEAQTSRGPVQPRPRSPFDHVARTRKVFHSADNAADPVPGLAAKLAGARSLVAVPMLKDNALIGVIIIYRQEVRPFTDKQIELVKNFAAQAVIAIENTRLLNELRQSLEQQTATSEVLGVISRSPGELETVFHAILENATRICEANFGILQLLEGEGARIAAMHNVPAAFVQHRQREPLLHASPESAIGRAIATRRLVHIPDYAADAAYSTRDPAAVKLVELAGARSLINVPMLKDDGLIGIISIYRQEVRPFTDKQIEVVQNFAAQAVIAIENARLLNELRHRTDDLAESLEQQTATSEVLRVISSSPGELKRVFQSILENATRICEASFGNLLLLEGDSFRRVELHNAPAKYAEFGEKNPLIHRLQSASLNRIIETKQPDHVADMRVQEPDTPIAKHGGARTLLTVPMLKESELLGAIGIYRKEVRPFTEKQIALVTNFAAQAVIAIENARLLNELRQRTDDLSEALEQQTATSQVLGVISSSPGELEPVFQAMLENAVRICDAKFGVMFRFDNEAFKAAALFGVPPALADFIQQRGSFQPHVGTNLERMWRTKDVVRIIDDSTEPVVSPAAEFGGARSLISVPMIKENVLIGAIIIYRQEVRPFTDKQIALVQNFAAQAVIAIENARLLNELRESLEQQTATSEVLRVISSSQGELEPVFQAMLANATRICGAEFGMLWLVEGDGFRPVALHGLPPALAEMRQRDKVFYVDPETPLRRLAQTKQLEHIADATREPAYIKGLQPFKEFVDVFGARTFVMVPMLKGAAPLGAMAIYRKEVRPFTDKQIELVKNFAAQAVIAIENTRLLNELRQRTDDLTESLEQQTATSEVLKVISTSPGALEPVFDAMLENALRICEAKSGNLFGFSGKAFYLRADLGTPPAFAEFARQPRIWGRDTILGQIASSKLAVHIIDLHADDTNANQDPGRMMAVNVTGARTALGVPMLRENELIGAFVIFRQEMRAFTDKQIALVQNFAAQAVIAIENTRLLNELRQRTTDLTESLEQQTATSKVLEVISRSAFDLHAVFETVAESSVRLCGADRAMVFRFDGELLRMAVAFNAPQALKEFIEQNPIRPGRDSVTGRAALERRTVQIPDVLADPEYTYGSKDVEAIRTLLGVPRRRLARGPRYLSLKRGQAVYRQANRSA